MNSFLKADLHVHTRYSHDSTASLQSIVSRCIETGIQCLAVTDHNTIEGALLLSRSSAPPNHSRRGGKVHGGRHHRPVPQRDRPKWPHSHTNGPGHQVSGRPCNVPHPFDRVRPSALGLEAFESIAHDVDIVETFNGPQPLQGRRRSRRRNRTEAPHRSRRRQRRSHRRRVGTHLQPDSQLC